MERRMENRHRWEGKKINNREKWVTGALPRCTKHGSRITSRSFPIKEIGLLGIGRYKMISASLYYIKLIESNFKMLILKL